MEADAAHRSPQVTLVTSASRDSKLTLLFPQYGGWDAEGVSVRAARDQRSVNMSMEGCQQVSGGVEGGVK